jgi:hypothetical protein
VELLSELKISDALMRSRLPQKKPNRNTYADYIREKLLCSQFLAHKRDILIIPHETKYSDGDGYYRCIFTDLLDRNLKQSHYILDGRSTEGVYARQRSKNVIYADIAAFNKITRAKYPKVIIKKSEINEKIISPIESYFNVSISTTTKKVWHSRVQSFLLDRKIYTEYYSFLLQKINPRLIIMVVAYDFKRMILCEAAHERKIPVVELQHGVVNKSHMAYNFPGKMKLASFPDYIFTFGQFFADGVRYPIASKNIISVGYPELEKNYRLYNKKRKNEKTILFISQGYPEFAQYANIVAEALDHNKYHIIFQLHPKEYFSWKNTVGRYLHNEAIEVVGSYDHTVHESLGKADWVVGCGSTVLYEAVMFDVKIVIMKLGAYCAAGDLYNHGYALLVDSPEQLIDEIEKDTFEVNKEVHLFEKNSLANMQKAIDQILGETS